MAKMTRIKPWLQNFEQVNKIITKKVNVAGGKSGKYPGRNLPPAQCEIYVINQSNSNLVFRSFTSIVLQVFGELPVYYQIKKYRTNSSLKIQNIEWAVSWGLPLPVGGFRSLFRISAPGGEETEKDEISFLWQETSFFFFIILRRENLNLLSSHNFSRIWTDP